MSERDDRAGEVGNEAGASDEDDCFTPPREPCECFCLHCRRTFMSSEIWFQRVIGDPTFRGFWMCPTPNCDGAGFTFDIFPTDPDHPANAGWHTCDEDDEEDGEYDEEDDEEFDEEGEFAPVADGAAPATEAEWDPAEPAYQELDDDDIEGEEWKHGLAPGEPLPDSELTDAQRQARAEREEEERRYDMPDERPRVLDWTNRPHPRHDPLPDEDAVRGPGGEINEEDIPF
jgi:hypothetical protein